jgi:ADP-heptose:LPS heptosyltransferase
MIIIAPLSNDALRDWPQAQYTSLIDLCLSGLDQEIVLIGSAEQRQPLNLYVRGRPSDRLVNQAGQWSWAETMQQIRDADLVVANNSGIAHLGTWLGRPTLCLFAASHDPHEWAPRGGRSTTLYVKTNCSPCGMSTISGCNFGHACMTQLNPLMVFETLCAMLDEVPLGSK